MNAHDKLPNPGCSSQQAHVDRPNQQIDAIPSIRALRLVSGLELMARRCVFGISRWRKRRNAIRGLHRLSDHYLLDIGLDRAQIVSRVDEFINLGDQPTCMASALRPKLKAHKDCPNDIESGVAKRQLTKKP